jgi:hypothetical protein
MAIQTNAAMRHVAVACRASRSPASVSNRFQSA